MGHFLRGVTWFAVGLGITLAAATLLQDLVPSGVSTIQPVAGNQSTPRHDGKPAGGDQRRDMILASGRASRAH